MPSLQKLAALLCVVCLLVAGIAPGPGQGMAPAAVPADTPASSSSAVADDTSGPAPGNAPSAASRSVSGSLAGSGPASAPGSASAGSAASSSLVQGDAVAQVNAAQVSAGSGGWPWGYPTSPGTTPNCLYVDKMGFFHVGNYDAATYKPHPLPSYDASDTTGHVCVWVPRSWHGEPTHLGAAHHIYDCASGCPWGIGVEIDSLPHDYSSWKTLIEPTDTTSGKKRLECSVCGAHSREEIIPPLTHQPGQPVPQPPAPPPCEHVWGNWKYDSWGSTGYKERSCQLCKKVEHEPCEHVWNNWQSRTQGSIIRHFRSCKRCGVFETYDEPLPPPDPPPVDPPPVDPPPTDPPPVDPPPDEPEPSAEPEG